MAHRLLPKDEQEKRDLRIVKLAEMGVLHADIARAVGLSGGTISDLLRRRRNAGKTSCQVGSGGNRGFLRIDSVDGLPV
jgi:transposase